MKKKLLVLLLTVTCFGLMVGCGEKKETGTSASSAAVTPTEKPESTPTVTPTEIPQMPVDPTAGEGGAQTNLPAENVTQVQPGQACIFTKDGQEQYQVVIDSVGLTDRRSVTGKAEDGMKVVLVTFTYRSSTDDPALVDDASFRMVTDQGETCFPYFLKDQKVSDIAGKDTPITAEVAYQVPESAKGVVVYVVNNSNPTGESFCLTAQLS